jgi:neutral ceramidase
VTARFRASLSVIDVTPGLGFPLGGYIFRAGVSQGVLDPILARLAFLSSGDGEMLLISLDWVYIDGRWAGEVREAVARETGIGVDGIIITATHTHSGPGVFRSFISESQEEAAYLSDVSGRIVSVADRLAASARDVTISLGSTRVVGLGAHRNDPMLGVDDELSVLTLTGSDGADVCRIITYGCHPTLLGPENLLFSADWVGWGLAAVDRHRQGTSLFINGAAGDVSSRFVRKARGLQEMEKYAGEFSEAVGRAEAGSVGLSDSDISVTQIPVPVSYRTLPDRVEAERALSDVEHKLVDSRGKGKRPGEIRRLESIREAAIVSLFFESRGGFDKIFGKRPMTAPVTLVRIGSADMIFFPGEVMSRTAISLKAQAPGTLWVCGYANDYFGYLSGEGGDYESSMRLLSSDSIERIIDAARRLLAEGM